MDDALRNDGRYAGPSGDGPSGFSIALGTFAMREIVATRTHLRYATACKLVALPMCGPLPESDGSCLLHNLENLGENIGLKDARHDGVAHEV
jgi:hypothetical protein